MVWRNEKIKAVKWNEFFQVEKNEYKVFKLIPHLNVSNQQNRHLWNTLHKAYELYHTAHTRTDIKVTSGLKVKHREKDYIWFDMIFRNTEEGKRIEFYFSTTETMAKKFRTILENKLRVTVEESELSALEVPDENTVIHEMKYMKHDIFTLNTNHNTQSTPIGSILAATDEMETGDFARISILNEREGREKWFNNASWAFKKLNKGEVPQRANISGKRTIGALKKPAAGFVNELMFLVSDTFTAVSNVFAKNDKPYERKTIIEPKEHFDVSAVGEKSRSKVNAATWKTSIRTAVHSSNKFNRDNVANSIHAAFAEIKEDNELLPVLVRDTIKIKVGKLSLTIGGRKEEIIQELNTLQPSKKTKFNPNVNLISCDELGKLVQLPTADVQRRHEEAMKVNKNVETDLPPVFLKDGLLLGHSEHKGERFPISLPVSNADELYKTYVFSGGMGMGKDVALQNNVVEGVMNHGISYIIFDQVDKDGRGGMANGIRDSLPADKIIDLDLASRDFSIPMDISEVIEKLGRHGADRFAEELIYFFGDIESMAQSKRILRILAKASGGSLYGIKKLIEDEELREKRVKELEASGRALLAKELDSLGDNQKLGRKADSIVSRLDDFFGNEQLFSVFAQEPVKELNFEQFMKDGKAVIIRLPDRKLSVPAVKILVHWITLKVLMTRLLMDGEGQENGTFLVYNELQTYMTDGLEHLLGRIATQGRKERLGMLLAIQHFKQLPNGLQGDLLGGGTNFYLFKCDNSHLFELLQNKLDPTFTVETAMSIPKYHAINILNFGGRTQHAFLVNMLPPSYTRYEAHDNSFLTSRHCRMFGRSYEEVERQLVAL